MVAEDYINEILRWRAEMDTNLRRQNDRLALAGLFWFRRGFNTFGSSPDCDIVLPKPAPRLLGAYEFDGVNVTVHVDIGQTVEVNGASLQTAAALKSDDAEVPSFVTYGQLRMVVIRRAHGIGLRLWDNSRLHIREFPARTWFPVNESYRLLASYVPYPVPVKVKLPNALGETEEDFMQGYVSFKLGGKSHSLDVSELDDGRLYIQFRDPTNGTKTYPTGRYHRTDPVAEDGQVNLDFNRAYNPPFAFTEFATCTFAPKQNQLKLPIEAGELYEVH